MKFEIGDKVIIQHSGEEGEIIDLINDKMVMVEVRGVRFPAYIDQLDFPYFKQFTEKKSVNPPKVKKFVEDLKTEKPGRAPRVADGLWLTFLPLFETDEYGDESVSDLKVHLINHTPDNFSFKYSLRYFGKPDFGLLNQVLSFQDFYLHDIPFESLNDSPQFEFEISLVVPDKKRAPHAKASLRLKPRQVFDKIEQLRVKGEATFSYRLLEKYPDREPEAEKPELPRPKGKSGVYDASGGYQQMESPKYELDLHIDKLSPEWRSMNSLEMLSLQLRTFEKYLELAIFHHQTSMIVIHGVGTGRLRDEIHEILRLRREVKSFVNQYDPRYGYGATEIFFEN